MRCTQWIGLTKTAEDFTKQYCESLPSTNVAQGMFEDTYPLGRWKVIKNITGYNVGDIIEEVEQAVPWSSGPMIFTYLAIVNADSSEYHYIFPWVYETNNKGDYQEYNYETGKQSMFDSDAVITETNIDILNDFVSSKIINPEDFKEHNQEIRKEKFHQELSQSRLDRIEYLETLLKNTCESIITIMDTKKYSVKNEKIYTIVADALTNLNAES